MPIAFTETAVFNLPSQAAADAGLAEFYRLTGFRPRSDGSFVASNVNAGIMGRNYFIGRAQAYFDPRGTRVNVSGDVGTAYISGGLGIIGSSGLTGNSGWTRQQIAAFIQNALAQSFGPLQRSGRSGGQIGGLVRGDENAGVTPFRFLLPAGAYSEARASAVIGAFAVGLAQACIGVMRTQGAPSLTFSGMGANCGPATRPDGTSGFIDAIGSAQAGMSDAGDGRLMLEVEGRVAAVGAQASAVVASIQNAAAGAASGRLSSSVSFPVFPAGTGGLPFGAPGPGRITYGGHK